MQEAIVNGTLLPDGTLQLHQPVQLPPGEVEVSVRSRGTAGMDVLDTLQQIWTEARRHRLQPRSAAEIDAEIESIRQAAADELAEPGLPNEPNTPG